MDVLRCIEKHQLIARGEKVAVAVSGGSDSMCLLHFLCAQRKALGIEIVAVNLEHGIRGEASIADSRFVEQYCASRGIPFIGERADIPKRRTETKEGTEEAARNVRYAFFNRLLSEGLADKVATAHNREDNAESILMHLFRGAGGRGLGGMLPKSGGIIRPLLTTAKTEILRYIGENGVPFVTDESNADTAYTRNYIRNELFGKVVERFPSAAERITQAGELIREDDAYLTALAEKVLKPSFGGFAIDRGVFSDAPIASRAVFLACEKLGGRQNIESKHINSVCELAALRTGDTVSLPDKIYAAREYGQITLFKGVKTNAAPQKFFFGERFVGKFAVSVFELCERQSKPFCLYVRDCERVRRAVFRLPESGDVFTAFGGVKKKLTKFLSDKKIPLRVRETLPVLADKNEILAVVGVEISDCVKVTETDKKIIGIFCDLQGENNIC